MERMNAYSTATPSGDVTVDIEGMMVDIVTLVKAYGGDKAKVYELVDHVWAKMGPVTMTIPNSQKQ